MNQNNTKKRPIEQISRLTSSVPEEEPHKFQPSKGRKRLKKIEDDDEQIEDKGQPVGKKISAVKAGGSSKLKSTDDCTNSNSQNSGAVNGQKQEADTKSCQKIDQKKITSPMKLAFG